MIPKSCRLFGRDHPQNQEVLFRARSSSKSRSSKVRSDSTPMDHAPALDANRKTRVAGTPPGHIISIRRDETCLDGRRSVTPRSRHSMFTTWARRFSEAAGYLAFLSFDLP